MPQKDNGIFNNCFEMMLNELADQEKKKSVQKQKMRLCLYDFSMQVGAFQVNAQLKMTLD